MYSTNVCILHARHATHTHHTYTEHTPHTHIYAHTLIYTGIHPRIYTQTHTEETIPGYVFFSVFRVRPIDVMGAPHFIALIIVYCFVPKSLLLRYKNSLHHSQVLNFLVVVATDDRQKSVRERSVKPEAFVNGIFFLLHDFPFGQL